jgi:type II secretory pathway component GspD/PulD (secretin)
MFGGRGGFGDPNSFMMNLRDDEFRNKLELSDEQNQELDTIRNEVREWFGEAFRSGMPPSDEDRTKKMAEFEDRAIKLMNRKQLGQWEEQKKVIAQRMQSFGQPGGPPAPNAAPPTAPAPPPKRAAIPNEAAPDGEAPTISFAIPGLESAHDAGAEPRMAFNFRYAPWAEVLKLFAETAGLTLDLNDTPTGTFNYYDDRQFTSTEALDVLNGYLLPKGYLLVRRDRFLVCLNLDDGIPPNLVPVISPEELPHRGKNELVSVVIPLDGIKADDVAGEVEQLLGPQGTVASLDNTNSLYVQDVGANVRRVYDLLKTSAGVMRGDTAFKSIPLKHIDAADAERMVRRLFGLNPMTSISSTPTTPSFPGFGGPFGGGFGGPFGGGSPFGPPGFSGFDRGGDRGSDRGSSNNSTSNNSSTRSTTQNRSPYAEKIWITADTRTNHLLVTAPPDLLRVVENAVLSLDTGTDAEGNPIVDSANPMTLRVYPVTGNASQVALTLSMMMPGLAITDNTSTGQLYVQATSEEHTEVAKLLQELGGSGSNSVAVITLYRLDPVAATNSIRNLFANEGARGPSVEADASGRRLMIRGTPDQVAQVKTLLADLGETGQNPSQTASGGGTLRTFPLQGRDPAEFLPLLRQTWSNTAPNPIRIVVPSQSSPIQDLKVPSDLNRALTPTGSPRSLRPTPTRATPPEGPDSASLAPTKRRGLFDNFTTNQTNGGVNFRTAQLETTSADEAPTTVAPVFFQEEPDDFSRFLQSLLEPMPLTGAASGEPMGEPDAATDEMSENAEAPPVGLTVVGDDLVITSSDPAALDAMENLMSQLATLMPVKTKWTVFYLRSADATETAQMLERLFPQSSVTTSTATSDGILGSLAGGMSSLGRGMMNVTGLNYTLGGQTLRIVTDIRANALFVTGPADTLAEVEQMLRLLDATELPTSLRDRVPRSIPVNFADIDEVAAIVQNVFAQEMAPQEQGGGGRNGGSNRGGGFNPLAMMMAGGANQGRPAEVQLTLGVDRQTSHLIVSCNDTLFREIEDLVLEQDERARRAKPVVRVMPLATADPSVISQTLSSLIPKVSVSSTRTPRQQPSQPGAPGAPNNNGAAPTNNGGSGGPSPAQSEFFRQMMEERSRSRGGDSGGRGGFGGGGPFGGGNPFGGGGPFGAPR